MGLAIDWGFMFGGIEYVCIAYGFMFMLGSTVGVAATFIGAGARDISSGDCLCDDMGFLLFLNMFTPATHTEDREKNQQPIEEPLKMTNTPTTTTARLIAILV
jgi:hypothetical protein